MSALATVSHYYEAFNDRNWEEMLALVDDNVLHEPNQGKPRHGKELFTDFMKHMDDSYEETLKDIVLFESSVGGRVAAEFTVHGIYKKGEPGLPEAKGQSYVLPAGAFLEVKHGKITRVTTYYNLEHWIGLVSR
jgi:steroid delta-isomerase-like uncharacterized protein